MKAVVASGHRRVSEIAVEILHCGGNAFDAMVAAGFVSLVAEPALTSLGGGGFLLARTASGDARLFDFFVDTPGRGLNTSTLQPHFLPITVQFPSSAQVFNIGHGAVAVPGMLRGLLHVHRRLGRMPLADILAPAVQLARNGLTLNVSQAYVLELLKPIMSFTPRSRSLFEPGGEFLQAGDTFKNPELADFLATLSTAGDREFYEGEVAARIVRDMQEHGGLVTRDDLSAYRVIERKPAAADFGVFRLLTNPQPSLGGLQIANLLRLFVSCREDVHGFGSAAHVILLGAVMQENERHPESGEAGDGTGDVAAQERGTARVRKALGGTTHVSICDREGNAASMSSSNGEGSGYVVPGTGIMLNNMMGEDDLHPEGFHASAPGVRVASMMSPSILLEKDMVCLVLGSGGSKRIKTAMLQVLVNVMYFGMRIGEAIEAPRLHWDGTCVQSEPGFAADVIAALAEKWPVNLWQVKDIYFGGVHAVSPDGSGGGDPRRSGVALAA